MRYALHKKMRLGLMVMLVVLGLSGVLNAQEPIENQEEVTGEIFIGQPATANPISTSPIPPHPFMAPNGSSNTHNDAYMSDVYTGAGPLGQNLEVTTSALSGLCVTQTFDSQGRMIATCLSLTTVDLYLIDLATLTPLATLPLPAEEPESLGDFTAGSYFYLDHQDHAFVPTIEDTIWEVGVTEGDNPQFEVLKVHDLTSVLGDDNKIGSVLPDFNGLLWFVTRKGLVGTLNPQDGAIATFQLENEEIHNSFAVDETGGVFIASDHALYRFDAGETGEPVVTWREEYDRGTRLKSGQVSQGTGTTPTLMGTEFITIADNADPQMNVVVYRRGREVEGERLVCAEPVFDDMEGSTENSLIATDTAIIVENNYGYGRPRFPIEATPNKIGMARVDVTAEGCETVWTNTELVPSVVSKLSLETGLIYTYTKDETDLATGVWYFTAVDFATGETVYKQQAGNGLYYNNHYAGLYLGADGTAYVGLIGGLLAIRDGGAD